MPAPSRVSPAPPSATAASIRARILRQAQAHLFTQGYASCTMDEIAAELGMSKKTLYVHFAGKDELLAAVIDAIAAELRAAADALLAERGLNFAEKLRGFVETLLERVGTLQPRTVRELQRFAPDLFRRVEDVRARTLPYIFGRFIEDGQRAGLVRPDLSPALAIEFFLHAMQGLMHPQALERLRLTPRDVISGAIDLFFGGLLTPSGRKQYEKMFPT